MSCGGERGGGVCVCHACFWDWCAIRVLSFTEAVGEHDAATAAVASCVRLSVCVWCENNAGLERETRLEGSRRMSELSFWESVSRFTSVRKSLDDNTYLEGEHVACHGRWFGSCTTYLLGRASLTTKSAVTVKNCRWWQECEPRCTLNVGSIFPFTSPHTYPNSTKRVCPEAWRLKEIPSSSQRIARYVHARTDPSRRGATGALKVVLWSVAYAVGTVGFCGTSTHRSVGGAAIGWCTTASTTAAQKKKGDP